MAGGNQMRYSEACHAHWKKEVSEHTGQCH